MIAGPGKWAGPVGPPHAAVITRLLQHAVPSTEKEHSPRRISEYSFYPHRIPLYHRHSTKLFTFLPLQEQWSNGFITDIITSVAAYR